MSFYAAPPMSIYRAVVEIRPRFDDNKDGGRGTGIIASWQGSTYVLTARHVVDPRYRPRNDGWRDTEITGAELLAIGVRVPSSSLKPDYLPVRHQIEGISLSGAECDNDLAAFEVNLQVQTQQNFLVNPVTFTSDMIAGRDYLKTCRPGEPVAFIGFPDHSPAFQWVDDTGAEKVQQRLPLYRQGVLSMPPGIGSSVRSMLGNDYGIIDGFAQKGYSGSPVIALQRGLLRNQLFAFDDYREAKVIGILCGHLRSVEDRANGQHAGLSYFVRSTQIRKLLEKMHGA